MTASFVLALSSGVLASCCAAAALGQDDGSIASTPVSTAITYQGELKQNGSPYSGIAEFHFKLFDAATGGVQVGPTLNFEGPTAMTLSDGRFSVPLNFGTSIFTGDARWLETEMRTGLGPFTTLSPRQPLTAAPYALYALNSPPNGQLTLPYSGTVAAGDAFAVSNTGSGASVELATGNAAVYSYMGNSYGALAFGNTGVSGTGQTYGVFGQNVSPTNAGGLGGDLYGVYGVAQAGTTAGVYGKIFPSNNEGMLGTPNYGVTGNASGGGYGVYGVHSSNNRGALGTPSFGVYAFGDFGGTGGKYFHIDYPLDPENKYLNHQCVEGPEPLLIYRGNVVLNNDGQATVQLPEYFEAINRDFQYQLTPIGGAAPNLHIAQEVVSNTFAIAGGTPGLKVSWTVTGVRNDPYMQRHAKPVIEDKPESERGTYLRPDLYGQPREKALNYDESSNERKITVGAPSSTSGGTP